MKFVVIGSVLFVGLMNTAQSQNSPPRDPGAPVHPGTAILDSMGISAGAIRPDHPEIGQNAAAMAADTKMPPANAAPAKP